jgi:hypothetical protein
VNCTGLFLVWNFFQELWIQCGTISESKYFPEIVANTLLRISQGDLVFLVLFCKRNLLSRCLLQTKLAVKLFFHWFVQDVQ